MPPVFSQPSGTHPAGMEITTLLLRRTVHNCAACSQPLDGHSYRFFSCHPDQDTPAARSFEAACTSDDWAMVHALQTPSVDQASSVVYALACPAASNTGGMIAVLRLDASGRACLHRAQPVAPGDFAALRAVCPTCQWVVVSPALQSGQEAV